ncbi:hypothetical protein A6A07_03845 [Streptomyces sp. CB03911]|nr:hypothetical protein A6A07_03845 [Streptomyces sp. CB03911]
MFARLREIADQLPQVPGIGKVEIAEGEIVMTTSPVSRHELAVLRIARQLNAQLPNTHPGYVAHGGADLEDAGLGRLRNPDLMVFREKALDVEKPAPCSPMRSCWSWRSSPSPTPRTTTTTSIVHDEPGYTSRTEFAFGDTVTVGPWTLDTGVLRTYA